MDRRGKKLAIGIIIFILILLLLGLKALLTKPAKQIYIPGYIDFYVSDNSVEKSVSADGGTARTPKHSISINKNNNEAVIGQLNINLPLDSDLKTDVKIDGDNIAMYISAPTENDKTHNYTSVVSAAVNAFGPKDPKPSNVDEARACILDYNQIYSGNITEWLESPNYLVRRQSGYDNVSESAVIGYTLLPKNNNRDPNAYVVYITSSDNFPLNEASYKATMDGLINMAGDCAYFYQNYDQVMEELNHIYYFKSASAKDMSLTLKEFMEASYIPWKEKKEMAEEEPEENVDDTDIDTDLEEIYYNDQYSISENEYLEDEPENDNSEILY